MINTSSMIKASDLKVGDKVCSVNGVEYEVITNHIGDVIFILNKRDSTKECLAGLHLFYDDIEYLEYAKVILNIDLSLW